MTDRERWNNKYQQRGLNSFGLSPSDWLVSHAYLLKDISPGKALDIACGNGRNAFFVASQGFEVNAVDVSDVVMQWVQSHANREGLPVTSFCIDLEKEGFPESSYQVILNFNYLNRALFPHILQHLAPKGLLFFETFYQDQQQLEGRKMNPAYFLDYNELLHAFSDLRIIAYQERVSTNGKKALASLIAQKP